MPGLPCQCVGFLETVKLDILFRFVMQAVADVIRTTLGPRSMLKMLLDASGGTFMLLQA